MYFSIQSTWLQLTSSPIPGYQVKIEWGTLTCLPRKQHNQLSVNVQQQNNADNSGRHLYCFHVERWLVLTVLIAENGTSYWLAVATQTGKREKTVTQRLRIVEVFISVRFATATVGCMALPSTPEHRMVPHIENRQHLKMTYIKNKTKTEQTKLGQPECTNMSDTISQFDTVWVFIKPLQGISNFWSFT